MRCPGEKEAHRPCWCNQRRWYGGQDPLKDWFKDVCWAVVVSLCDPGRRSFKPRFPGVHPEQEASALTRFATVSSDDTFRHNLGAWCGFLTQAAALGSPPQHRPRPAGGLRGGSYLPLRGNAETFSHALLPHSLPNFPSWTSGFLMHTQILLPHHRGSSWSNERRRQALVQRSPVSSQMWTNIRALKLNLEP